MNRIKVHPSLLHLKRDFFHGNKKLVNLSLLHTGGTEEDRYNYDYIIRAKQSKNYEREREEKKD